MKRFDNTKNYMLSISHSLNVFVVDVTSLIFRNLAASGTNLPVSSVRGIFRGISMSLS